MIPDILSRVHETKQIPQVGPNSNPLFMVFMDPKKPFTPSDVWYDTKLRQVSANPEK